MNIVERAIDAISPVLSVRLRILKNQWRRDSTTRLIPLFVNRGDVTVDVGANRGVYTWQLSATVGPTGRVHAIEPFPRNVGRLRSLAQRRENILVYPVAVSEHDDEAELHVPSHRGHLIDALATLNPASREGYESVLVPVRTLDELLASESGPVTFLKCDVEGHEDKVIQGGWGTIRRHRPVIMLEIEQRHRTEPVKVILDRLYSVGYEGYFLHRAKVYPISEFDLHRHQLVFLGPTFTPYSMPADYVCNFLFVPAEKNRGEIGDVESRG